MTWFYLALIRNGEKNRRKRRGSGQITSTKSWLWQHLSALCVHLNGKPISESQNLSNLKGLFATRVFNVEVLTEFLTIFPTVAEVSLIHPRWLQPFFPSPNGTSKR